MKLHLLCVTLLLLGVMLGCNQVRTHHQAKCYGNVAQLYLLFELYRSEHKCYPKSTNRVPNSPHEISWRVIAANFKNEANFDYNFGQPWNNEANLRLTYSNKDAFCSDSFFIPYYCLVITEQDGVSTNPEVPVIIEVSQTDFVWTEPRDITIKELEEYDVNKNPPFRPGNERHNSITMLAADGYLYSLPLSTSGKVLAALSTKKGIDGLLSEKKTSHISSFRIDSLEGIFVRPNSSDPKLRKIRRRRLNHLFNA